MAAGEASGIFVLDVDPKNGGDRWLAEHRHYLPKTRVHRTRSGGEHWLYRWQPGIRGSRGRLAPGIDIISDGSPAYFIWWPRAGLPVLCEGPVAEAGWLIGEIDRAGAVLDGSMLWFGDRENNNMHPSSEHGRRGPTRFPFARVKSILGVVYTASPGTRNERLFWAACRFGEMLTDGVLTERDAWQWLEAAARHSGLLGDDGERAVQATITSGLRRR